MKFLTSWFTLLLLSLLLIPAVFAESPSIQLFMNGKQLVPEVSPRIVNGNTIVPVRIIAESLGSKVSWDAKQRKVSVDQGQTSIQLFIDKTSAVVNGKNASVGSAAGHYWREYDAAASFCGRTIEYESDVGRADAFGLYVQARRQRRQAC